MPNRWTAYRDEIIVEVQQFDQIVSWAKSVQPLFAVLAALAAIGSASFAFLRFREEKKQTKAMGSKADIARYFSRSIAATVIAFTPVAIVGSGSGANSDEWSEGSGLPPGLREASYVPGSRRRATSA